MIEPITKEILVPIKAGQAFRKFTEDMGKWWPLDAHSVSANARKTAREVKVGKGIGAQITEVMFDGKHSVWGTITNWKDGQMLEFTWHPGKPETEKTRVKVTFEESENGTLVRLVHSGWDELKEGAEGLRAQYDPGWDFVFGSRFGGAAGG